MNIVIKTLSHQPLNFYRDLPKNFPGPRLPGGEIISASGDFGNLCLQEFDGGNFIIRYSVLESNEPFVIDTQNLYSGIHAIIMLRNGIHPVFRNQKDIKISEGQFTILEANQLSSRINFNGRQQYICFETILSHELAFSLLEDFSDIDFFSQKLSTNEIRIHVKPAQWTDQEVKDHIHYILTYSDPAKWRRNYFENRVRDIMWKLLALYLNKPGNESELTDAEKDKAYEIQRLILEHLDEHLLIRDLAQKVTASESKIKMVFKKVFGKGIHEYRTAERIKKAIQLINEGKSVKEAAAETGWRSADLGKAYYKVYGTTPGTLRRKKRQ